MDYPLFDFTLASILMGLGIGTDVALATLLRAKQLNTTKLCVFWIVGVSATHTLFPMAGYLLSYFSIQLVPALTPIIGVIAFACIFYYLKDELVSYVSGEENESEENHLTLTLGLILAVSWDALWSGPAKSAQVIGWPELLVWLSFVLAGAIVALLAIVSLVFAKRNRFNFERTNQRFAWMGYGLQYSVIAYFGLLALLRYTLQLNVYWWQVLIASTMIVAVGIECCRLILTTNKRSSKNQS